MAPSQLKEAELKLEAYRAATGAVALTKDHSYMGSAPSRVTVAEVKTEAERLWAWMTAEVPKETSATCPEGFTRVKP